MLQFLLRRQTSHAEVRTTVTEKMPLIRKTSEGSYLERKTRHGSIFFMDVDKIPLRGEDLRKNELIQTLKRDVKRIMDESASWKQTSLQSPVVTALCVSVENCLLDGLRRQLLGLFGVRTTFALLCSIAKTCAPAANVAKLTSEHFVWKEYGGGCSSSSSSSYHQYNKPPRNHTLVWIKVALREQVLSAIVDHIFSSPQCRRYYEKGALMLDMSRGGMVAAILVGPCAVDYTLLNTTMDMEYQDPTADELVQRSRIASTISVLAQSPKKPPLSIMKRGNSMIRSSETNPVVHSFNRDYVFSLHQNQRSVLLYGKNNVGVANNNTNIILKGYLSLHREHYGALIVKWTPNQLMHSSSEPSGEQTDNNHLWKYVINIAMEPIIYIHLHQQGNEHPVSLVFVDTDGVQYAPFHFPPGQHCISFLTCLETGLSPFFKLDPPLWNVEGKGKILPQLRRKTSNINSSSLQNSPLPKGASDNCNNHGDHSSTSSQNGDITHITDYVFRIIKTSLTTIKSPPQTAPILSNLTSKCMSEHLDKMETAKIEVTEGTNTNDLTMKKHVYFSVPVSPFVNNESETSVDRLVRNSLGNACETMRIQLLSRAFHGWLTYTRHLKTIRTHLSCLVTTEQVNLRNVEGPVNRVFWEKCRKEKTKAMFTEFTKRVYCYGIDPDIRVVVWPYLTKMVTWTDDIESLLPMWEEKYTKDLQKWGAIEEEVIKRDQEAFRVARLRQSSVNGDMNFSPFREQSINNDVFEGEVTNDSNSSEQLVDITEEFGSNLHRIEKDVDRCDRTKQYFSDVSNLKKLKRIMCTYVWRHINDGYIQGMCDIAAPMLVMYNDEIVTLQCFECLMNRMRNNFPHGNGIEENLGNLQSIVQVMDPELYGLIMLNADFTHLYFAYRWFLLDFKRELTYEAIYQVWEVIIAAENIVTLKFQLFFAFALLTQYRHILIENKMEFTDMIKFFNEMAEKHNVDELLVIAREKLCCLQALVREMNS